MYEIEYSDYFEKQVDKLKDKGAIRRILRRIKDLELDPGLGEDLLYELRGYKSLRIGDWRVAYIVQQESRKVIIVAMGHGHDVYDEIKRYLRSLRKT